MTLKVSDPDADRCFDPRLVPSLIQISAHAVQEGPTLMTYAHVIRPRNLMWLPAAILMAGGVLAAIGAPLTPNSNAASSSSSTVTATVSPELTVGGTCDDATVTGSVAVNSADTSIGAACSVTVSTNNHTPGVRLKAESDRPTIPALCKNATTTVDCGTAAIAEFADTGTAGEIDMTDGEFGLRPAAGSSCTTSTWVIGTAYGLLPDIDGTAGSTVCTHNMGAAGTYNINYSVDTVAAQESGNYHAAVLWVAEAV